MASRVCIPYNLLQYSLVIHSTEMTCGLYRKYILLRRCVRTIFLKMNIQPLCTMLIVIYTFGKVNRGILIDIWITCNETVYRENYFAKHTSTCKIMLLPSCLMRKCNITQQLASCESDPLHVETLLFHFSSIFMLTPTFACENSKPNYVGCCYT